MSRFTKSLLGIASTCLGFGLILCIVGFALGGRLYNINFRWDNGPRVYYNESFGGSGRDNAESGAVPTGAVSKLDVDIGMANVEFKTGDAYGLSVTGSPKYQSEYSGDTWTIETDDSNFPIKANDITFTITVPRGVNFRELELSIGAGTLKGADLACEKAELSVGAGAMKLQNFVCTGDSIFDIGMGTLTLDGALKGNNSISTGMGTAKFTLERPGDYGYEVDCGMGSVKIDGESYSGMASEGSRNNGAATFYDVDCGMGTVKIEF